MKTTPKYKFIAKDSNGSLLGFKKHRPCIVVSSRGNSWTSDRSNDMEIIRDVEKYYSYFEKIDIFGEKIQWDESLHEFSDELNDYVLKNSEIEFSTDNCQEKLKELEGQIDSIVTDVIEIDKLIRDKMEEKDEYHSEMAKLNEMINKIKMAMESNCSSPDVLFKKVLGTCERLIKNNSYSTGESNPLKTKKLSHKIGLISIQLPENNNELTFRAYNIAMDIVTSFPKTVSIVNGNSFLGHKMIPNSINIIVIQ